MVVIENFEMPKSCLMCTKRKCLHIDGKAYQMCGLNEDGYLRESWFNSENIPIDCRSEYCPLREVEAIPKDQYEARLTADMVAIFTELLSEIEELKLDYSIGECEHPLMKIRTTVYQTKTATEVKYDCEKIIQQKIDALKGVK